MLLSGNDLAFEDGRIDLSFDSPAEGWAVSPWGMSSLSLALGDPERGPMVGLFAIPTRPGDEEKFPPIIHMHRSDSFRTIMNGDFYVGRKIYADGEARLQAAGAYYGPEQPGPEVIARSGTVWSLLVFGDKRGHKVEPADKKYREMQAHADKASEGLFRKLGMERTLPDESSGESHIETNLDLPLAAGHANLDFADAGGWPLVGASRLAAMAISNPDCGPVILGLVTPQGEAALPAAAWGTEVLLLVVEGQAVVGGRTYGRGDLRIQESGVPQPAVRAGAGGLKAYVMFADRRGARARAGTGDAARAAEIDAVLGRFGAEAAAA